MLRSDWIAQLLVAAVGSVLWQGIGDFSVWLWLPWSTCLIGSLWLGRGRTFGTATLLPLLLVGGAALLLPLRWQSALLLGSIQLLAFIAARFLQQPAAQQVKQLGSLQGIQTAFLISGFSALIYQVVWQRRLIEALGANNQSVATIIAIFMLGLGVGSLMADRLLARATRYGLQMFCLLEVGIGLIGIISLPVLEFVSTRLSHIPQGWGLIGFVSLILLPPTLLMGATLPILVDLLKRHIVNFHENVGRLYAVNALGSAVAALCTALLFFNLFGQTGSVVLAASCNSLTALMIWVGARHWHQGAGASSTSAINSAPEPLNPHDLGWPKVALLAGLTGLVSLSQEVLLLKQISWMNAGRAETFGLGVGLFLLGLASGSWQQIHVPRASLREFAARNWLYASACFTFLPFASTFVGDTQLNLIICYLCLAICGFFGARTLPMVAGMLRHQDQTKFGRILTSNIIGSVLGSLIIGNWLLDYLHLINVMLLIACLGIGLALMLYSMAWREVMDIRQMFRQQRDLTAMAAIFAFSGLALWPWWSNNWLERMMYGRTDARPFIFTTETKSGIVAVALENQRKVVYGGGVYDGAVNTLAVPDLNGIARLYRLLGMHDAPADVLEIGLASGSWARVMSLDPRLKHMTSVEINPAYLQLVQHFPEVAPILLDPKSDIVIDDGRRWLKAHPERKFDLIVSNTTFHWRVGATMITSAEFMQLTAKSLKPGGLLFLNTTYSANVVRTARQVFPHVALIGNVIVASQSPLDTGASRVAARLQHHPLLQSAAAMQAVLAQKVEPVIENPSQTVVISDDQMNEEFGNKPDRSSISKLDLTK